MSAIKYSTLSRSLCTIHAFVRFSIIHVFHRLRYVYVCPLGCLRKSILIELFGKTIDAQKEGCYIEQRLNQDIVILHMHVRMCVPACIFHDVCVCVCVCVCVSV